MENEEIQTDKSKRVGSQKVEKRKINKGLIITAIILTVILLITVVFALVNKLNDKVYSNVFVNGINVAGKTEAEVLQIVKELGEKFSKNSVAIKYNSKNISDITPAAIEMAVDEDETLKNIMNFGRSSNIVSNNFDVLKALFKRQNIQVAYKYSDVKLTNIASEITTGIEGRVKDDSFILDEESYTLVITKGKSGKDIVVNEFKEDILKILKDDSINEYNLTLDTRKPKELDVDVVYAKIHKEAKDAYVDDTVKPIKYNKHEVGVTFDKTKLRELLSKDENKVEGKTIKFKLTTTQPKVKIQDITKGAYQDVLGTHTSSFLNSDANRASNVRLGASMLNGTVIMPGETFSFNATMGDCGLSSRGFKSAAVFKSGKVVQEIGGGICQISSTLYMAALYANLDIVSRSNHALPVGYVPVSLDATIYYPYLDFKFKNTRSYPVKIVATTTSSRKLTISIKGTKEEKEYDIELNSWVTASVPSKVIKQNDKNLQSGKTKVIQSGAAGYKSVAYKTVKYKGKIISKTLLSSDVYGSMPRIIAVGTKKKSVNIYND